MLSDKDRELMISIINSHLKVSKYILLAFRCFGVFQILLIFYAMYVYRDLSLIIPCILVGVIYFKFTNFLYKKSMWYLLLIRVSNHEEIVIKCVLDHVYRTRNGDSNSSKESIAVVLVNSKEYRCKCSREVQKLTRGTTVSMICDTNDIDNSYKYIIP